MAKATLMTLLLKRLCKSLQNNPQDKLATFSNSLIIFTVM
jgi:hypothetical protein